MSESVPSLARTLYQQLGAVLAAPVLDAELHPLQVLRSVLDVQAQADELVAAAVALARKGGSTWQEIGDILGVSRQAAFQRFGKPLDPRTGEPMNTTPFPAAAELAEAAIDSLALADWDAVTGCFDKQMSDGLSRDGLAAAWAQIVSTVGAFQARGQAEAIRAADLTITTTPLHFEAGELVARISFRDDHAIAGLYILAPTE